jgi:periplasmic protein TonB
MNITQRLFLLKQKPVTFSLGFHFSILISVLVFHWGSQLWDRWYSSQVIDLSVIEVPNATLKAKLQTAPPKEKPKPVAPARRAVFGVSKQSLNLASADPNSAEVKAGNTTAKAQDQEKLKADDPDALPIPVEEYLVSQMPRLISETRIPYPPVAKKKGIQGPVVMDLLIDASGKVRESTLITGPSEDLNQAALAAIKNFVFEPAKIDGGAVAVKIRYSYRFVLEQ